MSRRFRDYLYTVIVPFVAVFALWFVFGRLEWNGLFTLMSWTFLFVVPFCIGSLTVLVSPRHWVEKIAFRIYAPCIPIALFIIVTALASLEGAACLIMISPIFFVSAIVGGLTAGYVRTRYERKRLQLSLIVLLPFIVSPMEHWLDHLPAAYEAYTFIDINADGEKIWSNVTRVHEIDETENHATVSRWLGFPRPVKAELNYEGVGASREAIFDKGLVFTERVISYIPQQEMTFTITPNTKDIPATTMDEHIVVGGKYFNVLTGAYRLETLPSGMHRLHLMSRFELSTSFNFYAGWWAWWIMTDIQNNILHVIRKRSQSSTSL